MSQLPVTITTKTKSKAKAKTIQTMGVSSSSAQDQDQDQDQDQNEEFSTHTAYDQIQAGREAALRVLQQSQSIRDETANLNSSSSSSSTSNSSSSSGMSSTSVKTKTKIREGVRSGSTDHSIENTFQNALNGPALEVLAKERRYREQMLLMQDMSSTMNARAARMNGTGTSGSISSSGNNSYSEDAIDDEPLEEKNALEVHTSDTSTALTDSNSMFKSNTFPARVLNQNGKDSKSHCFLSSDLIIDEALKNQLNNDSPRFANHGTRRPSGVGFCYVYVWNGVSIVLESIEEHIELITKIVYSIASQEGIVRVNKDGTIWNMVKCYLVDKNADWVIKDIISITLATTILNTPYLKEFHGKWSNQVSSILITMKQNFTMNENGR